VKLRGAGSPHVDVNQIPDTFAGYDRATYINQITGLMLSRPLLNARILLYCTLLPVLAGCAGTEVKMHTYPADMVYIEDSEIESAMLRLSQYVWSVNDIFDSQEHIAGYNRERIIELLKNMEKEADELGAGARQTNHLFIDQNIEAFRADVERARRAVETDPPNYYLAGRLSGSCLACHTKR